VVIRAWWRFGWPTRLLLSVGIALAVVACGGSERATSQPGLIAFTDYTGESTLLFVVEPDGTDLRQLTDWSVESPAISPDGRIVAFDRDGQIGLVGVDGANPRLLTSGWSPVWSPDGDQLLLDNGVWGGRGRIYVVSADGSRVAEPLTASTRDECCYAWSQDGHEVFFARVVRGGWTLHVITANGEDERMLGRVFAPDGPFGVSGFAWSPDRRRLLLEQTLVPPQQSPDPEPLGNAEIFVINVDGSGKKNLTNNVASDGDAAWSPDGEHIVFVSNRSGNDEVWRMSADGRDVRKLTHGMISATEPTWAVDGSAVAFASAHEDDDYARSPLWVVDAAGSEQRQLLDDQESEAEEISWSAALG